MTLVDSDGSTLNPSLTIGVLLIAILLNTWFFGIVSQQFYVYWTSGFKDLKRIKIFVTTQYFIITFQSIILWQVAWNVFIVHNGSLDFNVYTWRFPVSSLCECILVLSANVFLTLRVHSLTESRLQSGLTMIFSGSAFVMGIVTSLAGWKLASKSSVAFESFPTSDKVLAATWLGLQAIAECLITTFLARALLRARSGLQKSDTMVESLVRGIIQIGALAALWAVGGLVTWFFLPKLSIYTIFSTTAGSMYTHVIYDTLLSRVRLREHMAETTHTEIMLPVQFHLDSLREQRASSLSKVSNGVISVAATESLTPTTTSKQ